MKIDKIASNTLNNTISKISKLNKKYKVSNLMQNPLVPKEAKTSRKTAILGTMAALALMGAVSLHTVKNKEVEEPASIEKEEQQTNQTASNTNNEASSPLEKAVKFVLFPISVIAGCTFISALGRDTQEDIIRNISQKEDKE